MPLPEFDVFDCVEQLSCVENILHNLLDGLKQNGTHLAFFTREYFRTSASDYILEKWIQAPDRLRRQINHTLLLEVISMALLALCTCINGGNSEGELHLTKLNSDLNPNYQSDLLGSLANRDGSIMTRVKNMVYYLKENTLVLMDLVCQLITDTPPPKELTPGLIASLIPKKKTNNNNNGANNNKTTTTGGNNKTTNGGNNKTTTGGNNNGGMKMNKCVPTNKYIPTEVDLQLCQRRLDQWQKAALLNIDILARVKRYRRVRRGDHNIGLRQHNEIILAMIKQLLDSMGEYFPETGDKRILDRTTFDRTTFDRSTNTIIERNNYNTLADTSSGPPLKTKKRGFNHQKGGATSSTNYNGTTTKKLSKRKDVIGYIQELISNKSNLDRSRCSFVKNKLKQLLRFRAIGPLDTYDRSQNELEDMITERENGGNNQNQNGGNNQNQNGNSQIVVDQKAPNALSNIAVSNVNIAISNIYYEPLPPMLPDFNLSPYLPPIEPSNVPGNYVSAEERYSIVLDLDETLVHYFDESSYIVNQNNENGNQNNGSNEQGGAHNGGSNNGSNEQQGGANDGSSTIMQGGIGTYKMRPYCMDFLRQLNNLGCEVVVFTAATSDYASWVLNQIDPHGLYIHHRLYRQHALPWGPIFIKDLEKLGRKLEKTLIIDNVLENFMLQPLNGIPISPWYDDESDTALYDLIPLIANIVKSTKYQKNSSNGGNIVADKLLKFSDWIPAWAGYMQELETGEIVPYENIPSLRDNLGNVHILNDNNEILTTISLGLLNKEILPPPLLNQRNSNGIQSNKVVVSSNTFIPRAGLTGAFQVPQQSSAQSGGPTIQHQQGMSQQHQGMSQQQQGMSQQHQGMSQQQGVVVPQAAVLSQQQQTLLLQGVLPQQIPSQQQQIAQQQQVIQRVSHQQLFTQQFTQQSTQQLTQQQQRASAQQLPHLQQQASFQSLPYQQSLQMQQQPNVQIQQQTQQTQQNLQMQQQTQQNLQELGEQVQNEEPRQQVQGQRPTIAEIVANEHTTILAPTKEVEELTPELKLPHQHEKKRLGQTEKNTVANRENHNRETNRENQGNQQIHPSQQQQIQQPQTQTEEQPQIPPQIQRNHTGQKNQQQQGQQVADLEQITQSTTHKVGQQFFAQQASQHPSQQFGPEKFNPPNRSLLNMSFKPLKPVQLGVTSQGVKGGLQRPDGIGLNHVVWNQGAGLSIAGRVLMNQGPQNSNNIPNIAEHGGTVGTSSVSSSGIPQNTDSDIPCQSSIPANSDVPPRNHVPMEEQRQQQGRMMNGNPVRNSHMMVGFQNQNSHFYPEGLDQVENSGGGKPNSAQHFNEQNQSLMFSPTKMRAPLRTSPLQHLQKPTFGQKLDRNHLTTSGAGFGQKPSNEAVRQSNTVGQKPHSTIGMKSPPLIHNPSRVSKPDSSAGIRRPDSSSMGNMTSLNSGFERTGLLVSSSIGSGNGPAMPIPTSSLGAMSHGTAPTSSLGAIMPGNKSLQNNHSYGIPIGVSRPPEYAFAGQMVGVPGGTQVVPGSPLLTISQNPSQPPLQPPQHVRESEQSPLAPHQHQQGMVLGQFNAAQAVGSLAYARKVNMQ